MTSYACFSNLADGMHQFWTASFTNNGLTDILFYRFEDNTWWLGTHNGGKLGWGDVTVGNTARFEKGSNTVKFWIGDFDGDGKSNVLMYDASSGYWSLGLVANQRIEWISVGNTSGAFQSQPLPTVPVQCQALDTELSEIAAEIGAVQEELRGAATGAKPGLVGQVRALRTRATRIRGELNSCLAIYPVLPPSPAPEPWPNFGKLNDGRPFWIGKFSRSDRDQVIFYTPSDGNWWLGSYDGSRLRWAFVGNTNGFGQLNDGRPFWIGKFSRSDRDQILFYYPGDGNWWLGTYEGSELSWGTGPISNTNGFGQLNDGRPFWIGKFSRSDRDQILFYYPGDGNWWLGTHDGNQLSWGTGPVSNTSGFGQLNDGRPFWVGRFSRSDRDQVLFYYPGDGNWWLGTHDGNQLSWGTGPISNTSGFGNLNQGQPIWVGNFSRTDLMEVMFYAPYDGNWWVGSYDGSQFQWSLTGNTGEPFPAGLGGWTTISINQDASVRWRGHLTNSDVIGGHKIGISALVQMPLGNNIAVARTETAPDNRSNTWDETYSATPAILNLLPDAGSGNLKINLKYSNDLASFFENLLGWIFKFFIVGPALAPVSMVVVLATEVGSLISTGSLVAGARIIEGVLWLAGPGNTLFAIAAEGITSLGSRSREVTDDEYAWANSEVFGGSLPPRDRLILTDTIGPNGRAFVFPRWDGKITINIGPNAYDNPRVSHPETFIHELVHTWQIEHANDNIFIAKALAVTVCDSIDQSTSAYTYGPAGPAYAEFNIEQQAAIVSDWFYGRSPGNSVRKDTNSPYFRYINENIRTGTL
jgi:hypothetical protein